MPPKTNPNPSANTAAPSLSDSEMKFMVGILSRNTAPLALDWDELAIAYGYKDAKTAQSRWGYIRKNKLGISVRGAGPGKAEESVVENGGGVGSPKTPRAGRKRKAAGDENVGEEEREETVGPAVKKGGGRKKARVEKEGEDAGVPVKREEGVEAGGDGA